MPAKMEKALVHGALMLIGFLVIIEGLGLALVPRALAFLAGPGAGAPQNRGWTRLQGAGFMLLGSSFVIAAASPPGEEVVAVVTLSMVACLMFSLAVLRRTPVRPAHQTP